MRGDDTAVAQGIAQKLKVGLLEEALGRTLRVRAVGDDDIELVLAVLEELKAIADVDLGVGVLEANAHAGQVLLGDADDGLVDVAQGGLLNGLVLDDLAQDTSITTADDKHILGIRVRVHGQVGDHLLIGELIALGALDDVVQDQHGAVVTALEDQDVLVLGLLVVQDLVDLKVHGLARPHVRLLGEPAICRGMGRLATQKKVGYGDGGVVEEEVGRLGSFTLDGGVGDLAHGDGGGERTKTRGYGWT